MNTCTVLLPILLLGLLKSAAGNLFSVGCGLVTNDGVYEIKDLAQSYAHFHK